jgi:hypothetical protein
VLNERHLKRLISEYVHYYHEDRTHLAWRRRHRQVEWPLKTQRKAVESYPCPGSAACTIATI